MIPLPNKPKIIEKVDNKATFVIEALYPGYGVTMGNALRRVLLSSLEGAAIIYVKIKGVRHEFSTIPGVLEDVISIMLNLKQLKFKLYSDKSVKATLSVKGEKEVKGSDFNLPTQAELVNKKSHVATLTDKKAALEMEIQIDKGRGYVSKEARKKEKLESGTIALDAFFTPVTKVSFKVENMRVGERTDFDRLFLEIETDASISPEEAFVSASETLVKHFNLFKEETKVPEIKKPAKPAKKVEPAKAKPKKKTAQKKKKNVQKKTG